MGDAKMVNMLATSFSWYFLKFYTLKMCDQHFARFLSFSVHSWIALLYFFSLSNGSEINCYLRISCDTVNSPLTNTSLRRTTPGVGPCHCPVIWLNYALYKGGNLSKKDNRSIDTFKTVNDPLRSALGSEKYRKTEMYICVLHDDR